MIFYIEIKEEAKNDILDATGWYASRKTGLEKRFIARLESILLAIQQNPKAFKFIFKSFRQAALKKFPYVVVYEVENEKVIIYAVFNMKQDPRKKLSRLRNK